MGTTFVNIDDYGFWMSDSILDLWLRFLALHIEEPDDDLAVANLIHEIRNRWLLASKGYFIGWIPVSLDEFTKSSGGKKIIINAVNSLLEALAKAPDTLNKDVLNLMGFEGVIYTADIDTWCLIEVGNAFIDLINGRIKSTAESTEFMPGCRSKPYDKG